MKKMAVIDDNKNVINIVIADSNEEETTNLITYSDENPAYIGGDYIDGFFYSPKPFASWTRQSGKWVSPNPYPTDGFTYLWNESNLSWELADFSEPN
jgi:hypothetical protein